jgi:hypothetical protein
LEKGTNGTGQNQTPGQSHNQEQNQGREQEQGQPQNQGEQQNQEQNQDSPDNRDFTFGVTDDKITITGYTGEEATVRIPSVIGSLPVVTIGDSAFRDDETITNVIIPGGIIEIESYAFSDCGSLKSVTIPDGVSIIWEDAFNNLPDDAKIFVPHKTLKALVAESGFPLENIIIDKQGVWLNVLLISLVVVVLLAGVAYWYFKIYKAKRRKETHDD